MVGERIKTARERYGWSQVELARRAGLYVDRGGRRCKQVARWENNTNKPGRRSMERLALALGVSLDWLETGRGDMECVEHVQLEIPSPLMSLIMRESTIRGVTPQSVVAMAVDVLCKASDSERADDVWMAALGRRITAMVEGREDAAHLVNK